MEFAQDQHGSRFLQGKLDEASLEERRLDLYLDRVTKSKASKPSRPCVRTTLCRTPCPWRRM